MSRNLEPQNDWTESGAEDGYLLLWLVVVCFLLLLALGVAAPRVAKQLERDREVESEHRAQEYVRAIQLYYRKNQRFPSSMDQLTGSGTGFSGISASTNIKYLRQQYKDPLTNDEFRLIHVGEAKTEVKGFFGEPLQGAPIGNLGSVAGMQSGLGTSPTGSSQGFSLGSTGSSSGSSAAATPASSSTQATTTAGTGSSQTASGSTSGTSASSGSTFGSGTDATTFQGSKGAFYGVGSNAKGHGLVEWNGSENIEDWEFLYDPRVELLKAKVSLFGGSPAASGSGSLGSMPNATSTSIFAPTTTTNGSTSTSGATAPAGNTPTTGTTTDQNSGASPR